MRLRYTVLLFVLTLLEPISEIKHCTLFISPWYRRAAPMSSSIPEGLSRPRIWIGGENEPSIRPEPCHAVWDRKIFIFAFHNASEATNLIRPLAATELSCQPGFGGRMMLTSMHVDGGVLCGHVDWGAVPGIGRSPAQIPGSAEWVAIGPLSTSPSHWLRDWVTCFLNCTSYWIKASSK